MRFTPETLNVITTDPRQREIEQLWCEKFPVPGDLARERWDDELVVYIWRDGGAFGAMGHAALKVRLGAGKAHYISWWPRLETGGGPEALFASRQRGINETNYAKDKVDEMGDRTRNRLMAGHIQPRAGQRVVVAEIEHAPDEFSNEFTYGKVADVKIPLPGLSAMHFGLFGNGARRWFFDDFLENDAEYKAASRRHNCAGIVRRALKAAGAEAFVSAPPVPIWARPNEVLEWAGGLRSALLGKNSAATRFMTIHRAAMSTKRIVLDTQGYPTSERWRRISRRRSGTRGQNVKSLDVVLDKLHAALRAGDCPAFMKARVKAFDIIERAVGRPGRDPHDKKVLVALGLSILKPFPPPRG